jgi:hypothetical protein
MAPLWPHSVTTVLSVDGGNPVLVNMQDPSVPATNGKNIGQETVQSEAIWGVNGLSNTQHTLIVSMQGDNAEVEMDGLMCVYMLCAPFCSDVYDIYLDTQF